MVGSKGRNHATALFLCLINPVSEFYTLDQLGQLPESANRRREN